MKRLTANCRSTIDGNLISCMICNMMQDMYNVKQAAEELQENPRTVSYWCLTGKLKATKFGRDYVILRADLEAFEQARDARRNRTK